ncbi:MAG: PmoA family protein, partial [Candidatus Aminicenantes bacterium]|nr:PmoA family protein [Candidatus Aminicenantes bacterium]
MIGVPLVCLAILAMAACASKPAVTVARDDKAGTLAISIGGREALVFQYGPDLDLAHYWPMRSPSGRNMLVQKTEPYPHHRSFWFADTVRAAGEGERDLSFYNALSSGAQAEGGGYGPPFRERVRLVSFSKIEAQGDRAEIVAELAWETDGRPVLDERRALIVQSLGAGEYLLDLTWTLTAASGDVAFVSDDVHYAWPYLRLATVWNGEHGGRIVSDTGATGQESTNMKPALWIDYSNTVEGVAEGVAVFQWPDGREHSWLTREYGCFGPRRPDDRSGRPFTLTRGETISQRVGVLVHRGDVESGRVRERYDQYLR